MPTINLGPKKKRVKTINRVINAKRHGTTWTKLRKQKLLLNSVCEICGKKANGIVHKIRMPSNQPIDPATYYDINGVLSTCFACRDKKQREKL